MEKITAKFDELQRHKGEVTADFLKTTPLADLQGKITTITKITEGIHQLWDSTNWEDLPDAETVGYETKRQEASDLRDTIINLIKPRVDELKAAEAASELAGAQGTASTPVTTVKAQMDELRAIHEQLKTDRTKVTQRYLKDEKKDVLEPQLNTIKALKDSFMQKFNLVDQSRLSIEQTKTIKEQKKDVARWGDAMEKELTEQITLINIRENTIWIKAQLEEKEKCDKEIGREKEKREAAEKERDNQRELYDKEKQERETAQQKVADLQQQLDQLEQQPSTLQEAEEEKRKAEEGEREALRQRDELQKELDKLRSQAPPKNTPANCPQQTELDRIERERNDARDKADRAERQRREAEREKTQLQEDIKQIRRDLEAIKNDRTEGKPTTPSNASGNKAGGVDKGGESDSDDDPFLDAGPSSGPTAGDDIITDNGGRPRKKDTVVQTLKLDTISLPYFSGDLTEWISFRDFFEHLIDKNKQISDTVKFHQLRSHLRGTAFDTIKGYQLIGTNYASAWADLKKRYDRRDDMIQEYIRRFLEVAAILHKPTFTRIRAIIDGTNQMLRALPSLGIDVRNWDPFVTLIIITKLDEDTRQEWKQRVGKRDSVGVSELLDFLETRAVELQPTQGEKLSQLLKGDAACRRPPRKIFQVQKDAPPPGKTDKKMECPICGGQHRIWNCEKLRAECAKVRTDMIRDLKMCFKCLLKHQIGDCSSSNCPYCSGPHNVLLCYKKENDNKRNAKRQANPKPSTSTKDEEDWD